MVDADDTADPSRRYKPSVADDDRSASRTSIARASSEGDPEMTTAAVADGVEDAHPHEPSSSPAPVAATTTAHGDDRDGDTRCGDDDGRDDVEEYGARRNAAAFVDEGTTKRMSGASSSPNGTRSRLLPLARFVIAIRIIFATLQHKYLREMLKILGVFFGVKFYVVPDLTISTDGFFYVFNYIVRTDSYNSYNLMGVGTMTLPQSTYRLPMSW
jgi:hypothetical protein